MKNKNLYQLFEKHPAISTDTRAIKPNSIFFALKGENFDGNNFAAQALKSGAVAAVIDNPEKAISDEYILVENVLYTLQDLAHYHREKLGLPILAITGTNGKTTTKELTSAVLSKKYDIIYTKGNFNNHIGVPLTLLQMSGSTQLGIVEMGANHPGEIDILCKIAAPDFGLITNVGKAHLEGFGSFEGVKNTKAELYRNVELRKGKIFINHDNHILDELAGSDLERISYGISDKSNVIGEITDSDPFLSLKIKLEKELINVKTNLIGKYNLENVLAAACVGHYFEVAPNDIKSAIEEYRPDNNRSQFIKKESNKIVMDAYNANPTSMQTSIQNFLSLNSPNKVLILGDMLELGKDSISEHQKIVDFIQSETLQSIYLVGENFGSTQFTPIINSFSDTDLLVSHLKENPISNCLILIKGSRGIRLEKTLEVIN